MSIRKSTSIAIIILLIIIIISIPKTSQAGNKSSFGRECIDNPYLKITDDHNKTGCPCIISTSVLLGSRFVIKQEVNPGRYDPGNYLNPREICRGTDVEGRNGTYYECDKDGLIPQPFYWPYGEFFCKNNKASECMPEVSGSCLYTKPDSKKPEDLRYKNDKDEVKCLGNKNYSSGHYGCHACVNLDPDHNGEYKILVVDANSYLYSERSEIANAKKSIKEVENIILGAFDYEPLKYLRGKNKFTIKMAVGDLALQFRNIIPITNNSSLSSSENIDFEGYAQNICGIVPDLTIVINSKLTSCLGLAKIHQKNGKYTRTIYINDDNVNTLTHELGHILGGLNDEYIYSEMNSGRNVIINQNACDIFNLLGISKDNNINCIKFGEIFFNDKKIPAYKTRAESMMGNEARPKFNSISCAYLLFDFKEGFTTPMTNMNDAIKEAIRHCDWGYKEPLNGYEIWKGIIE